MTIAELVAKISLDQKGFDSGLDKAQSNLSSFAEKAGKALQTVAKITAKAVTAGAGAVVLLTRQATKAYSEYEQLAGGVSTLFGTNELSLEQYAEKVGKTVNEDEYYKLYDSEKKVLSNANEAWRTAGMSANQYMTTATAFAGTLLRSVNGDTQKAAEMTDKAIIQIADNANKMGTSIEYVQQTYTSLSRGIYTTFDNLQLGYAGTKKGVEQALKDAEAYLKTQGIIKDFSVDNYADIIEAVGVLQEKMGIAGTTEREASKTLEGSLNSAKASWQNFVASLAQNDILLQSKRINELSTAIVTYGNNLKPVIINTVNAIAENITKIAPMLTQGLVNTVVDTLPQILNAGASLVTSLASAIIANLPKLIDTAGSMVRNLMTYLSQNVETILDGAFKLLGILAQGLIQHLPTLVQTATTIISKVVSYLLDPQNVAKVISVGLQLIASLAGSLIQAGAKLVPQAIAEIIRLIFTPLNNLKTSATKWANDMMSNFVAGIRSKLSSVTSAVSSVASRVKNFLGFSEPKYGPLSNFHTYAPDMIKLFVKGIKDNQGLVDDVLNETFAVADPSVPTFATAKRVNVVQNIYSEAKTSADLMREALYQQERAVLTNV